MGVAIGWISYTPAAATARLRRRLTRMSVIWTFCDDPTHTMTEDKKSWPAEHFSQANPKGPDQGNVPALPRRVAETIESLGAIEVQDLVLHNEVTPDGDWPSITVYFSQKGSKS